MEISDGIIFYYRSIDTRVSIYYGFFIIINPCFYTYDNCLVKEYPCMF